MDVEQRARDALNEVCRERGAGTTYASASTRDTYTVIEAVCRLIEQQDAFRREVSDAVKQWKRVVGVAYAPDFDRFILPEPVDVVAMVAREMVVADGVVRTANQRQAILDARSANDAAAEHERRLREALAKRGLSIVATVDGEGVK